MGKKGDYLKYSIEEINKKLEEKGYKWIEGNYINRNSNIIIQTKEGYKALYRIGALMNGQDTKIFFSKNPYTLENIKLYIKLNNYEYELCDDNVYVNCEAKLKCICKEHGEFYTKWRSIRDLNISCSKCNNMTKHTLEEIKQFTKDIQPNIEILSKEYKNAFTKMKCKCKIDETIFYTSWHGIHDSKYNCPECRRKLYLGNKNYNFNPLLTDEEREKKRCLYGDDNYKKWRNKVFNRDNYRCSCCGGEPHGDIEAHHLDGWNWCVDKRLNEDNGITLCRKCHYKFHKIYGRGNNTKEQFEEFINMLISNQDS